MEHVEYFSLAWYNRGNGSDAERLAFEQMFEARMEELDRRREDAEREVARRLGLPFEVAAATPCTTRFAPSCRTLCDMSTYLYAV